MGYNKKDLSRIRAQYSQKYLRAREAAEQRTQELYAVIPELFALDRRLASTASQIMAAAMSGPDSVEQRLAEVRENNRLLHAEREALLLANGYPADYTDVHYECEVCGDTGYLENGMCSCMKRALILAGYESSGIAALMSTQRFDNFSLDFYPPSAHMDKILENVKAFAQSFDGKQSRNMLFMGGTGLGKTHLSTAVAKTVIDRGFDVLYVPACKMLADFEQKRFGNSSVEGDNQDVDRYYSADLLIVDDLGTEMSNQFALSCIYDVINTRSLRKKSTIISTNLSAPELRQRYWDRITSRIFGEYIPIVFTGTDIRQQKIARK